MTLRRRSELLKQWGNLERMVAPIEVKSKDEKSHTFRGSLSTSHLDLGNGFARDIVHPGAFKRWSKHFRAAKDPYVPLIDSHDRWSIFNVYGHLLEAEERLTGKTLTYEMEGERTLEVDEMFLDTHWQVIDGPDGQRLMDRLRPGSVRKMSMGYEAKRVDEGRLADGTPVRHLREVAVEEGSLVIFPMQPNAEIDLGTVKGFLETIDPAAIDEDDRRRLTALQKEIGALLAGKAEPGPAHAEALAKLQQRIVSLQTRQLVTRIEAVRHLADH